MLLLRIGLHRSSDHSRAQQLGSAAWALYVGTWPLSAALDPDFLLDPAAGASATQLGLAAVIGLGAALVNSSHGLSFAHKTTLALVLLLTPPLAHFFHPVSAATRASVGTTLIITVYCWSFAAGYVCAHVMERLAARLYLMHEQLQESHQRLHYDLQNPARPSVAGPASSPTSSSSRRVSFAAASPSNGAAVAGPSQAAGAAPALMHEAAPAAAGPSTNYDGASPPLLFTMSAAQRSSWLQSAAAAQLAHAIRIRF